jgi:flagellar motor switch protein FliM
MPCGHVWRILRRDVPVRWAAPGHYLGGGKLATGNRCGAARMAPDTAFAWVDRLLGGASPAPAEGQARTMDPLEATLLVDIVGATAAAFGAAAQEVGGAALRCGEGVSADPATVPGSDCDIFCVFRFEAALGETCGAFAIALASDALLTVAEPNELKKKARPADENRKAMIGHLEWAPIPATVRLGHAVIPLRDALTLEPGDVLILNRKAGEPVELVVKDRTVTCGFPAQCEGRYAFQVGDRRAEPRVKV